MIFELSTPKNIKGH